VFQPVTVNYWYVMCCNLSLFTVTGWNTAGMLCAVISLYLLLLVGTLLVCYVLYSLITAHNIPVVFQPITVNKEITAYNIPVVFQQVTVNKKRLQHITYQ
jgi:chromate transport protein ChrA